MSDFRIRPRAVVLAILSLSVAWYGCSDEQLDPPTGPSARRQAGPPGIAAAIAARTKKIRIGTNLLLLPLYDPVRLAEDAAAVSLLAGGRFDLGVGGGFVEKEFETFGRKL